MAVHQRSPIGAPSGAPMRHVARVSTLPRLLASNEARLDRLQQRGVAIKMDGVAFLLMFFDRVRTQPVARDNHLEWGRFIAQLLDELEPLLSQRDANEGPDVHIESLA
jgi:hypothetical protein